MPEHRPHESPALTASEVLFVVNGARAVADRSLLQHRTWCATMRCVYVTDSAYVPDPGMLMVPLDGTNERGPDCRNDTEGRRKLRTYQYAQDRFLRGLASVQALAAPWLLGIRWYALIDDDSYVFPPNLLGLLGSTPGLSHTDRLFMGDFVDRGTGAFACGGGGFVFSRAAIDAMDLRSCIRRYHNGCAEELLSNDVIISRCAADYGVRPVREFSCGTCGAYDRGFTSSQLRNGSCFFAQMQRSHNPIAYLPLIQVPTMMQKTLQGAQQQHGLSPLLPAHMLPYSATLDPRVSPLLKAGVRPYGNTTMNATAHGSHRISNRSSTNSAMKIRPHVRAALNASWTPAKGSLDRGRPRSTSSASTSPALPLSRQAREAAAHHAFAREAALRRARLAQAERSTINRTQERLQAHDARRAALQVLVQSRTFDPARGTATMGQTRDAVRNGHDATNEGRRLGTQTHSHNVSAPMITVSVATTNKSLTENVQTAARDGTHSVQAASDPIFGNNQESSRSAHVSNGSMTIVMASTHRRSRHLRGSNSSTAGSMPSTRSPVPFSPRLYAPPGLGPAIIHRLYELVSRDGAGPRPVSRHLWAVVGYDPSVSPHAPGSAAVGSGMRSKHGRGAVLSPQLRQPSSHDSFVFVSNDSWRPPPADAGRSTVDVSIFHFPNFRSES